MTTVTTEPARPALPKISIVTPSFNQGQYLEQCIQSVLDQDYPNLEYIIMDGGSTDGSVELIRHYASKLQYWQSKPDGGHYVAVAEGFKRATGDILAWINSDDMYVPGALRTVASIFQSFPEVHWISTLQQLVWDHEGQCVAMHKIPGYSKRAFLDGVYFSEPGYRVGFIQQESTFWSRSLWESAGGLAVERPLAADFDLWCRFYQLETLYGVASPIAGFRYHESNRSQDIGKYLEEANCSLNALRSELGWNGRGLSFKWLDHLSRVPKVRGVVRLFRQHVLKNYSAINICPVAGDAPNSWEMQNVRF